MEVPGLPGGIDFGFLFPQHTQGWSCKLFLNLHCQLSVLPYFSALFFMFVSILPLFAFLNVRLFSFYWILSNAYVYMEKLYNYMYVYIYMYAIHFCSLYVTKSQNSLKFYKIMCSCLKSGYFPYPII
jgi:hypothetical protein